MGEAKTTVTGVVTAAAWSDATTSGEHEVKISTGPGPRTVVRADTETFRRLLRAMRDDERVTVETEGGRAVAVWPKEAPDA